MIAILIAAAIVVQEPAALRTAPRENALQQTILYQGDALEVRGQRLGYLQVYDHRRERSGYIRTSYVRTYSLEPSTAPELLSIIRFLRDTPGAEALGIGYAALFLKAADASAINAEIFDLLGGFADRLAKRASARKGRPGDEIIASHLDVAAGYGVIFQSFDRQNQIQICYEGEAFRRVLALPSDAEQRARAALALSKYECSDPNLSPVQKHSLDLWRSDVLDKVDLSKLPAFIANRIRIRRAGVWAGLAFQKARQKESGQMAADRAIQELSGVDKAELADEDNKSYTEAAIRASASRWAAGEVQSAKCKMQHGECKKGSLMIVTASGKPGETCVKLTDAHKSVLTERCTYGIVWTNSFSVSANNTAAAIAVQTLDTWRELWVFHKIDGQWKADVIPPNINEPDLGYIEFAGWTPDSTRILAAREAWINGKFRKSFEIIRLDTLDVEKQAESPTSLTPFHRWQDPEWKRQTLILR